jgi:signal transduction histidine kinase
MKWWFIFGIVFLVVFLYIIGFARMAFGENYDEWMNRFAMLEIGILFGCIYGSWGKDKFKSVLKDEWLEFLIFGVVYFFLFKYLTVFALIIVPSLLIARFLADKF